MFQPGDETMSDLEGAVEAVRGAASELTEGFPDRVADMLVTESAMLASSMLHQAQQMLVTATHLATQKARQEVLSVDEQLLSDLRSLADGSIQFSSDGGGSSSQAWASEVLERLGVDDAA